VIILIVSIFFQVILNERRNRFAQPDFIGFFKAWVGKLK